MASQTIASATSCGSAIRPSGCEAPPRPPTSAVPGLDYESHATGLDRNELGALLVAAGLGPPGEHALIFLLALNGLRVSEATGSDIEAPGLERGHRTLVITRGGGKVVTIPLAPRTARAVDLAISERCQGPVFLAPDGRRLDRHGAGRIVRRVAHRAGIAKNVGRTRCGMPSSPPPWTPACPCGTCRKPRVQRYAHPADRQEHRQR